ncbi:MAG TPA: energy transducer TonB [Saprospiraceae bacterium]|nr:energy transducer TonB [Saprospiraceae bacterium]HNT22154.1 energy transducer TonB [Saprospiraceae bacterium]
MNKLIIFLIVVTGLTFSCNNSQTTTNEQISVTEESKQTVQTEETTSDLETLKDTNKTNTTLPKQAEVIENESTISWADFYKQLEKRPQVFSINNSKDTLLSCLEGTTVRIRSNTFVSILTGKPISGNIKITVTEYYKLSDILLANLTTTSDNSLLETAGMIYIAAVSNNENCKIKDGQKIEIGFPTKAKNDDMQIFSGDWDNNRINWLSVSNSTDLNKIYTVTDVQPQFPGGDQKMMQFISKNIKYPNIAKEFGIQGTVYIRFTIDRDGNVKDANVFRGIDPDCDREALNAVLQFPKFKPAQVKGENVHITYTLPINFRLDGGITKSSDIKQNFENTYSDSTINMAHSNHITSYLFSTTQLGWINCDRFIFEKGERVDLIVKLDKKAESDVKIVFHGIKSIMPSFPTNDKHTFNKIPKGEMITIVAIKNIANKPHLAIKETVTSTQTETDFTFQPITMETLKSEMKKLDKIN